MASPFQQQALQRKLLYAGLILALFTGAWVWRHWVVDAQARDLSFREEDRGEVELPGAVLRLSMLGSRGLVTCGLWYWAQEKQKKNQWNELELLVRTVTKLQPHFTTPWQFQSWNLAYNVSVESDRVRDKYFYVTRGLTLLAEGERQNRDNPELRFWLGFHLQQKINVSDETNVMRSLAQLSLIPPNERDPNRFRAYADPPDGREIRWWDRDDPYLATHPDDKLAAGRARAAREEFEKFCQKHPQLVRRLREGIARDTKSEYHRQFKCETPGEVIGFLADNERVPSLYEEAPATPKNGWEERADKPLPLAERFPPLPPRRTYPPGSLLHLYDADELDDESPLGDDVDGHTLARAWFAYAQEPLPDPDELPGSTKPIVDRVRQHKPKMTTLLFRHYPPLAQSNAAKRLAQEGWFDEKGWLIADWFPRDEFTAGGQPAPAVVGAGPRWSLDAWGKARDMWQRHGENNHLLFGSEAKERNMRDLAAKFISQFPPGPDGRLAEIRPETLPDDESREAYKAIRYLREYDYYLNVSNFKHHYENSGVEAKPETVAARKCFFDAERARMNGLYARALASYHKPEGLAGWRDQVLLKNKDFRNDTMIQEETADVDLRYLRLYEEQHGRQLKERLARLAPVLPLVPKVDPKTFTESLIPSPFAVLVDGRPLVPEDAYRSVLSRLPGLALVKPGNPAAARPPTPAGQPPQMPGPRTRPPGPGAGPGGR
jgi:hypothetical protein